MNIEELKAELKEKATKAVEVAKEKAELASITARLAILDSPNYQQALVREQTEANKVDTLTALIEQCKAIITDNPVEDRKARQNRRWNGQPVYGLGKDIELLHTLCTGLLFSVEEHKLLMSEVVNLNLGVVEQFKEALGNHAYFNPTTKTIVPEVPTNVEALNHSVLLLGEQLGLVLNVDKLTESYLRSQADKALYKAEAAKEEHDNVPVEHFTM